MLLREFPFLGRALALSLLLHVLAIVALARLDAPTPRSSSRAQVLNVALPETPAAPEIVPPLPVQPTLLLPEPAPRHPSAAKPVATARQQRETAAVAPSGPPQRLAGEAARQATQQLSRELFYPPEAVERGLEGEALVLLFLDASGNAIAARLESSSGHALLDDAAVKAARTLKSLPDSAPREALLPVRFRLR
jgi:protein TonB